MRIRILKQSEGIVDGVSLSHFVPGLDYEVPASVGHYLIQNGSAEEISRSAPALVVNSDNPLAFEQLTRGVVIVPPQEFSTADDREPRRGVSDRERRRGVSERRRTTRSDRRRGR